MIPVGAMTQDERSDRIAAILSQWEDIRGRNGESVSRRVMAAMLDELRDMWYGERDDD